MRLFQWLCATDIPPACDLRRCGWQLVGPEAPPRPDAPVALAHRVGLDRRTWTRMRDAYPGQRHERVLILGVGDSDERARLLAFGFGDVLDEAPALGELEARAARVAARSGMLPGHRTIGPLRLDLFARDAFVEGRALALHPREFALLWRLADTPGVAIPKRTLLGEVWRLCHMPETNSLAVHVFRLRAKLASAGLSDLVQTAPAGGYLLMPPAERIDEAGAPAIPMLREDGRSQDLVTEMEIGQRHEP